MKLTRIPHYIVTAIRHPKRTLRKFGLFFLKRLVKIDQCYLHGSLVSQIRQIWGRDTRFPDNEHSFFYKCSTIRKYKESAVFSKEVQIPVVDMIRMQYHPYISNLFNRYDIAMRWLAIEQMEGKNDFGQEWDNMMQIAWVGCDWQQRFESLYKSIKENGYDESSIIDTDWNLHIKDGSHRLSIALYQGKEFVNVRLNSIMIPDVYTAYHGRDDMYRKGFNKEQISVLDKTMNKILAKCSYPFVGILWPASRDLWDEILQDIREYNPDNVNVRDWIDVEMTEEEVSGFIKAVYFLDDVTSENLELKRQYNIHSSQITDNRYPIRIVRLDIKNPYYRVKSVSGLPQSREIIHLKEMIRGHYAPRIYDYKRDVIFHVADNYLQSKFIWQLMQVNRDISDFYSILLRKGIEYTIIKRNKLYSPPHTDAVLNSRFVIKTDIDLLTTEKQIDDLLKLVIEFSEQHFGNIDWVEEEEEVKANFSPKYNRFYRIKMKGFPIFLFHIQSRYFDLRENYIKKILANKRIDGVQYVVDNPEYEVYIRLADLLHYPNKKHHIEYVRHYRDLISDEGIIDAFEPQAIEKAKQKLKEILS